MDRDQGAKSGVAERPTPLDLNSRIELADIDKRLLPV